MFFWAFNDNELWEKVKNELLSWVNTPYLHMQAVKGRGADCNQFIGASLTIAGILNGVIYKYYPPDWSEHSSEQLILQYIELNRFNLNEDYDFIIFDYLSGETLKRGDMLCFSLINSKGLINHVGIYLGDNEFIHMGHVCEVIELNDYYKRHLLKIVRLFKIC